MLTITDDARFIAEAVIQLRGRQAAFKFEARLLPTNVLDAAQAEQRESVKTQGVDYLAAQKSFVRLFLTGWPEGEVADKQGQPLAFSDDAVEDLLNQPGVPLAMVKGFYAGYQEATEGNSAPLLAG